MKTPAIPVDATRLPDLPVGMSATITAIADSTPQQVAMRLRHLGFRAGNLVQRIRVAPLGDPSVYRILGYEMCLRRHEAGHVHISVVS
jgi:ferrous iron transport protein A